MREAEQYQTVTRRGSQFNRKEQVGGGTIYIPSDVLCKALKQAGIPCEGVELKCKSTACKDGKRAKIIIHILKSNP